MTLWRVHSRTLGATDYNPTAAITRFTPVTDDAGGNLPYLYLGKSEGVAIAETALHDVTGRSREVPETKLLELALSELGLTRPITLIDLTGHGLSRIGQSVASMIASPPTRYCLLYTSPSPRDLSTSRMPSSA